jgi:hypothetical protein
MKRWTEQILSIPLYLTLFPMIPVLTHWSMVKGSYRSKRLRKASFSEFLSAFDNQKWEYDNYHPYSLFDATDWNENYFHASIFVVDRVGYLLTPIGFYKAIIWQRKKRKTLPSYRVKAYTTDIK